MLYPQHDGISSRVSVSSLNPKLLRLRGSEVRFRYQYDVFVTSTRPGLLLPSDISVFHAPHTGQVILR